MQSRPRMHQEYSQVSINIDGTQSTRSLPCPRFTPRRVLLAILAFALICYIVSVDPAQSVPDQPRTTAKLAAPANTANSAKAAANSPNTANTAYTANTVNIANTANTATNGPNTAKAAIIENEIIRAKVQVIECKGTPGTRYAVLLDAGSSGTRIHTYTFQTCTLTTKTSASSTQSFSPPVLLSEDFHQISPGLSSSGYANAREAVEGVRGLMDKAVERVPVGDRGCTRVAVKATAGLRMLGDTLASAILTELRKLLASYPFMVSDNAVEILDGRDEGTFIYVRFMGIAVYAWITVNHLLKQLGKEGTSGIMDLGGGSTQIAFENTSVDLTSMKNGSMGRDTSAVHAFRFGSMRHDVYQHSYLGYGLNSARETILSSMLNGSEGTVESVCLSKGVKQSVNVKSVMREFKGAATDSVKCRAQIKKLMFDAESCTWDTCSFNGIFQPSLTPSSAPFHIFSYFYERIYEIGGEVTSLDGVRRIADGVCGAEEGARVGWCLDLSYMVVLMEGYGVGESEIRVVKKVDGVEVGWCLGAAIEMVEKDDKCGV